MEAADQSNSKDNDMLSNSNLSGSSINSDDSDPLPHPNPDTPIFQTRPANPPPPPPPATNNSQHFPIPNNGAGFSLVSPPSANTNAGVVVAENDSSQKKKRGRPRKYDADGNLRASYAPSPTPTNPLLQSPPGFGIKTPPFVAEVMGAHHLQKMKASRSGGSASAAVGEMFAHSAGGDFTPHVVTVSRGEDVAGKILLLGQQGHKGICVLSAIGVVSNVTIRQPSSSGGILTYEGRFEILSLTGSYTVANNHSGGKGWVGALSVSLAGPDGRVLGGGVAGSLTAASPTQLVVGSFTPGGYSRPQKRKYVRQQPRPSPVPAPVMNISEPVTAARPISQAMPAEEAFQSESSPSFEHSHEDEDNSIHHQQIPQQPTAVASHGMWSFGPSPDINLSIHGRVTP